MKLIKGEFKEKLDLLLAPAIRAGFPSPAEDYLSDSLDFNRDLIKHPEATFYGRVEGDSMIGLGIDEGDIAVIDRSIDIQKVTDSFALLINSSNGTLTVALNADRYQIFGDRTHLTNTITNLIENAIKYSTNSPEILVNTLSDEKHFIVSVSDHGIGIPQKSITKIFDNFYRVPHGNIHNVKGYGLGLGYVKKIIHLHHGRIEVQSAEGKGSTFTVYLPLKS